MCADSSEPDSFNIPRQIPGAQAALSQDGAVVCFISFSHICALLGLSPLHHPEIIEIDRLVIILEQERKKRVAASSPNLKNSCITVVHAMLYCTSVYAVPENATHAWCEGMSLQIEQVLQQQAKQQELTNLPRSWWNVLSAATGWCLCACV